MTTQQRAKEFSASWSYFPAQYSNTTSREF